MSSINPKSFASQIAPVTSGSGSNTEAGRMMEQQNSTLTMQSAQLNADAVYDPAAPTPQTKAQLVQAFTNMSNSRGIAFSLSVAGILMIVYSFVSRNVPNRRR
jgi:hypothetical protein